MGIENNLQKMLTPDDALLLCDGFFEDKTISRKILNEKNLLDAAETLIEIGYENDRPYKSRCDVVETALKMGWFPCDWPQETIALKDSTTTKSPRDWMSRDWISTYAWGMFGAIFFGLARATSIDGAQILFAFSSGASMTLGLTQLSRDFSKEGDRSEA